MTVVMFVYLSYKSVVINLISRVFLMINKNSIHKEIKCRIRAGNSCYYSVQTHLSSRLDN